MKKILASIILVFCITLIAKAGEDQFINALRNCSKYHDSGIVDIQGISVETTKSISGWNNDKCTYKENIKMNDTNMAIVCKFSGPQIKEISSVADAYFLTLKYSGEKTDTSSLDAVKNNPITNVFNKYLQDPSVCSFDGLQ